MADTLRFEPVLRDLNQSLDFANRRTLIDYLETSLSAPRVRRRRTYRLLYGGFRTLWSAVATVSRRTADTLVAAPALLAFLPVLVSLYVIARRRGGGIQRVSRLGLSGSAFREFSFRFSPAGSPTVLDYSFWRKLPALLNVLCGDMSIIGPRPFSPAEVSGGDRWAWRRFQVKPGLICLWWIRRRANIAYRSETESDAEYVEAQSIQGDVGIMLRSIPAAFYGSNPTVLEENVQLLDIPVNNWTLEQAVEQIVERGRQDQPSQVCFVNADCVNISYCDADYKSVLQNCGIVLADGIGVKLAGRLLKCGIRQNVNGTDLLPVLCQRMHELGLSLYLLGGKPGVAQEVLKRMLAAYPGLQIKGHQHGFFSESSLNEVTQAIKSSGADILLVAMGAPKQEKWIRDHLRKTGCKVGIGVGGLFDFYSGRLPRAPQWIREIGMEWLFRFWQEPRRMWRRYLTGNLLFLGRVLFRLVTDS